MPEFDAGSLEKGEKTGKVHTREEVVESNYHLFPEEKRHIEEIDAVIVEWLPDDYHKNASELNEKKKIESNVVNKKKVFRDIYGTKHCRNNVYVY